MKHIVIGDIHGRTSWKQIIDSTPADMSVCIGDYFDPKQPISTADQIANFQEIVAFKRSTTWPGCAVFWQS